MKRFNSYDELSNEITGRFEFYDIEYEHGIVKTFKNRFYNLGSDIPLIHGKGLKIGITSEFLQDMMSVFLDLKDETLHVNGIDIKFIGFYDFSDKSRIYLGEIL